MHVPETEVTITRGADVLARYTVRPGDYVIGRNGADIAVDDAFLSERHAQLTVNYQELLIEDLGSESGTFINEQPVVKATRLWPGQKVQMGTVVMEAHRVKAPRTPDQTIAPVTATVRRLLPEEFLRDQKYKIGNVVAHGGMGAILNAHEVTTGRKVAMKVMLQTDSETDLHRFVEEAQVTAQLEHPNIIPVHELGVDEQEQVFYTMKYVRGITLKKVIALLARGFEPAVQKYSLAYLLTVLQKVCDAVAFAHSKGVIHRDLKPENVMLGDFGEVLVMDWGLAKVLNGKAGEAEATPEINKAILGEIITARAAVGCFATMAGTIVGTPQYMSPEQAIGAVEMLDTHTDIYALGAILYSILALRPPVNGTTPEQVLDNVRFGRIRPLKGATTKTKMPLPHIPGGRVPDSLAAVAMKALSLSPEHRYHSVTDFQADIAAYQDGFATGAEQAGLIRQMMLLVARHKSEAAILAACAAVLLAIGPFFYLNVLHQRDMALAERQRVEDERARTEEQRNLAQNERDRANAALAALRRTAPAYYSQARTLADNQDFNQALEKIAMAQSLAPEEADYELFRAHLLQAMQRLPEAIESYRRALSLREDDASAQANLALCETLLKQNGGELPLTAAQQVHLLESIKGERRNAEAVWLAHSIGRDADVAQEKIASRLRTIMLQPKWATGERLRRLQDGTFALDLAGLTVPDLSPLRELPISDLRLGNCGATDLAPLATMPLQVLDLGGLAITEISALKSLALRRLILFGTKVTDLGPLAEMPLTQLNIGNTPVVDLSPLRGKKLREFDAGGAKQIRDFSWLRGMPLETLNLSSTSFHDPAMLRAMPLRSLRLAGTLIADVTPLGGTSIRHLDLFGCSNLHNLSPLVTCANLESLLIPTQSRNVDFLRRMPNLRRVANQSLASFNYRFDDVTTVAEFFRIHGPRLAALTALTPRIEILRGDLRKLGLSEAEISRRVRVLDGTGGVSLDLAKLPLSDLGFLAGLPLQVLNIDGTKVGDLTPLHGMPLVELRAFDTMIASLQPLAGNRRLERLWISNTPVNDLAPLAGMPLTTLHIGHTRVRDLTPLQKMPLRQITIDNTPIMDVMPLLNCPTLEDITVSLDAPNLAQLRRLPKLAFIGTRWNQRANQTTAEFWTERDLDERTKRGIATAGDSQFAGRQMQINEAKIRLALKPLTNQSRWNELRIRPAGNDGFSVDLSELAVLDLSILRDLPITRLNLRKCGATDLKPLTGLSLVQLDVSELAVSDWKPLGQIPTLRELNVNNTSFSDLKPLRTLRLTSLRAQTTGLTDLTLLKGMPLELLDLKQTGVSDLNPVRGLPLKELYLWRTRVTDFSPLEDCRRLEVLDLSDTAVADLQFLKTRKLRDLRISRSMVSNLSALEGVPLVSLQLTGLRVSDYSPLLKCPTLETISIQDDSAALSVARELPNLKRIAVSSDGVSAPLQDATEFWAAYIPRRTN